jgi:hypothetical protein
MLVEVVVLGGREYTVLVLEGLEVEAPAATPKGYQEQQILAVEVEVGAITAVILLLAEPAGLG